MDTLQCNIKDNTILESLNKAMSYNAFRELVKTMAETGDTTGNEKNQTLIDFTKVNESRMKRWDKTLKVSEEAQEKIKNFNGDITWLVLAESWCGDAAHIVPVINKVAELSDNIDLKIVLRDDNDALMNMFLTNGGKSIPKLIMIDNNSGAVVNTFGPRPQVATQMVVDYKNQHGALTPEFKEALQVWYNLDKGQSTISDLLELL